VECVNLLLDRGARVDEPHVSWLPAAGCGREGGRRLCMAGCQAVFLWQSVFAVVFVWQGRRSDAAA
jgi:hypothetical protein